MIFRDYRKGSKQVNFKSVRRVKRNTYLKVG